MIIYYGYCNYLKKLKYSTYIVHQLKDIVTPRPQCMLHALQCILIINRLIIVICHSILVKQRKNCYVFNSFYSQQLTMSICIKCTTYLRENQINLQLCVFYFEIFFN